MKKNILLILSLLILSLESFSHDQFIVSVENDPKTSSAKQQKQKRRISLRSVSLGVSKALDSVSKDPFSEDGIWDLSVLKRETELSNLLHKFLEGNYANKAKTLDMTNLTKAQAAEKLLKEGFEKKETDNVVDKMLGRSKDSEIADSGEIYVHPDGSLVRIKDYSNHRKHRPQAYLVKAALKNPSGPPTWQNEAFKISNEGYPIPKGPRQNEGMKIHAPSTSGEDEDRGWVDLIMEEAHLDIK
ncbi:MAG: hypothetical protein SFT91_00600 [Rickettsiaceae bacterium]|nr:hypothetical protein [Rickettsiaceae bacterium]